MSTSTPKLPIPHLEDALALYENWVNPLLNTKQKEQLQQEIQQFKNNEGPKLDKKLREYIAQLSNNENWMAPYWTKMYLSIQDSLFTESNYGLHLNSIVSDEGLKYTDYMAKWILKSAEYYKKIYNNPSESHTEGSFEICNKNANNLFASTRIPNKENDQWIQYKDFLTNIVVTHMNCHYLISVFDQEQNLISQEELTKQLNQILQSKEFSEHSFVNSAYLGSKEAYVFLEDFLTNVENKKSFDAFNQTIFHTYLPNKEFSQYQNDYEEFIVNPQNQLWPYSPINFVLWNNEQISVYMEHTGGDGGSMMYNLDQIKQTFNDPFEYSISYKHIKAYEKLNFTYSPSQIQKLNSYKLKFEKNCDQYSFFTYSYKLEEGRSLDFSLDTYTQLMIQYGMYEILKAPRSIYCSCSMGHFNEGRTEALRPLSNESFTFVQDLAKTSKLNKDLLLSAILEHKNRIKLSKKGCAFPRYLSGLLWMSENAPDSAYFFNSNALKLLGENYFSTSNIGAIGEIADGFYFTPPEGSIYGIGYQTSKNEIRMFITYRKSHNNDLLKLVKKFNEFHALISSD